VRQLGVGRGGAAVRPAGRRGDVRRPVGAFGRGVAVGAAGLGPGPRAGRGRKRRGRPGGRRRPAAGGRPGAAAGAGGGGAGRGRGGRRGCGPATAACAPPRPWRSARRSSEGAARHTRHLHTISTDYCLTAGRELAWPATAPRRLPPTARLAGTVHDATPLGYG